MQFNFIRFLVIVTILFAIDFYAWQAIKLLLRPSKSMLNGVVFVIYWAIPIIALLLFIFNSVPIQQEVYQFLRKNVFPIIMILYIAKLLIVPFVLMDDIIRLGKYVFQTKSEITDSTNKISRNEFITGLGVLLGAFFGGTLIFGILRGPYKFQIIKRNLKYKNLPEAFKGFKIVQISDYHLGSWKDETVVKKSIDLINSQKPDLILFTGDLVNDKTKEAIPYKTILNQLKAPYGVYSVLGNHDYGDYAAWNSPEEKQQNLNQLIALQKEVGWIMLNDAHTRIRKNDQSFVLAGVQNWGARGNFPKYGNLKKALEGTSDQDFIILMSHDPSHWKAEVVQHPSQVNLTLAGHTHGMQFGVDSKLIKWSPVQWMYKEWMDIYYHTPEQALYVNRGIGFIGYPGRVGIDSEITVITLG